jgi:hypothetical protein
LPRHWFGTTALADLLAVDERAAHASTMKFRLKSNPAGRKRLGNAAAISSHLHQAIRIFEFKIFAPPKV